MSIMFDVSSARHGRSIQSFGLDVSRMGAARGIAGGTRLEADGIFLPAEQWEVDWFVRMNKTGGPVEVWHVDGVDAAGMVGTGTDTFINPG